MSKKVKGVGPKELGIRRVTKLPGKYLPKRLPKVTQPTLKDIQKQYPDTDIEKIQKPS